MTKPSLTFQLSLLGFLCLWFPMLSCAQIQVPRRTATARGSSQSEMQPSKAARSSDKPRDAASQQKIQFSFAQEEWKEVINWFAKQAGFSLQPVDEWPEGTFDLVDDSEYTVIDALDQLNRALRLRDPAYTLVRNRNMLILVEADQADFPTELVETVRVEDLDQRGIYETMRCVFDFGELVAVDFESQLKQLVSDKNPPAFAVFPTSNQIQVRETGGTLRVIRDIIATARQRQIARDSSYKVYRLKHTDADSFLFVARGLLGLGEGNAREDGLSISAEPLSDRLFVKGTTIGLQQFDEVAALLDVPPEEVDSDGPLDKPFSRSYPVTSDPKLAFDALQTFLDGRDGVLMQQDEITGAILVLGREADHKIVLDTLATIEGSNGQQFAIIPLQYADPQTVILTLRSLYGQTSTIGLGETADGPVLLGNPLERTVIVKGTPTEVTQVKAMIAKLDGAATRVSDGPRTTTRVIPVDNDAKRDQLLNSLDDFWPSTGRTNNLRFNQVLPQDRSTLRERLRGVPDQRDQREQRQQRERQGSGTRMEDGSGSRNNNDARPEDPPFDVNWDRARQRTPWQGSSRSLNSLWRSATRNSVRLLTRSSTLVTCWVSSRCQLSGLPIALIAAPKQTSSFSSQATGSQSDDGRANPDYVPPEQPDSVPGDDIRVKATDGGIVIASGDLDALDDLEELIRSQLGQQSEVQIPQVFYLKHRYADEMVAFLSNYFGLSGADDGAGGGGLFGGVLDNVVGGGSGDIFDSFLGGSDGLASDSILQGDVRFVIDTDFNSMFVTGATETDLLLINDLIDILDQPEGPNDPELLGTFRTIQIYHRDAEEVKEIVEMQLGDLIVPSGGSAEGGNNNQQQGGQQQQMARLLATVAGGGGGGNGGGGGGGQASDPPRARLTVDTKTSQLLVTGPRFIFNEVMRVVEELDKPQLSEAPTLVVIPGGGNSDFIKRGLKALFGSKVEIADDSSEGGSSSDSSSNDDDKDESSNASQQAQRQAQQQQQQRQFERAINQRQRQNNDGGRGNGGGRGGANNGGGE